ncbi:transporter [Sphingomonas hankyongi]|uniref:Transporter n=1 Tax=Sphingomonas hankyongi TaxID=2908209 RepID=A0ABT0RZY6_9SPHN|nr:transporter [Sphingomonas hankyongi]MCL6729041.1 transporter [Sphingomonas hankyongi]
MRWLVAAALLAVPAATAAADIEPICADRPAKGTGTCTVPAGHLQVETDLADWTSDKTGGFETDYTVIGATMLKYGIGSRADVEIGIVPFESLRVKGGAGSERASGIGDTVVRAKVRLTNDDSALQAAIDPFVKIPTAKHDLGNRKVEAGLVVPLGLSLGGAFSLASSPEIDLRSDADGHGHHAAMIQMIDVGIAATPKLSLTAELWGQWDWNPGATIRQYSADAAVAYLLSDNVQLDGGANFGLNRQTPDVEIYTGVSARF